MIFDIILGKIRSHYCFKYFFSSFFSLILEFLLCILPTFVVISQSLDILIWFVYFSVCILFAFQFWEFLLIYFQAQILSSASLLINPCKTFFISVTVFLIIYIVHCSCLVSTLSIKSLSILIIVILKSQSDNSNIPTMSGSDVLSLQILFFAF